MRKLIALLAILCSTLSLTAQDVSLDFVYNGITYTVVDEAAKTCKTKAGSMVLNEDGVSKYKTVYGNTLSGNITIPEQVEKDGEKYTVTAIGDFGFSGISAITLPESLTEIGQYAFIACDLLTGITIPASVSSIGSGAFYDCQNLSSITLPEGLTSIPYICFGMCKSLLNISLPASVVSIGENAFSYSGLTSINLHEGITDIGQKAFIGCRGITDISFPSTMTSIPAELFSSCRGLKSITIPASITQIGSFAFYHATALESITCEGLVPPATSADAFSGSNTGAVTLNVYNTSITAYKKNSLWGIFGNIKAIPVAATAISLDKSSMSLNEGFSGQLTATLTPAYATDPIVWTATGNNLSVDSNGKVIGGSIGNGVVTVTAGNVSASCDVTITRNPSAYIKITPIEQDIYPGSSYVLTGQKYPSTITTPITWSSSNPAVAFINETSGELTAISPGAAVITASCDDITSKYTITVKAIEAESIVLSSEAQTLTPGGTVLLTGIVMPENTSFPTISWMSNDETVASVSDGLVTALAPGQATITATCGYVTATCVITVNEIPASEITLDQTQLTLRVTQSHQLTAVVSPDNTTYPTVSWATDNEAVATVAIDGTVTAVGVGNANIIAVCGEVSAKCAVTVEPTPADEVIISMTATTLRAGQTQQLTAVVPEETTDKTITWISDAPQVATVSTDGLVTAVAVGTANVTASCGNVSAVCVVTVEPTPAEQIVLSETNVTVNVGESYVITAEVLPEDTTDKTVFWSSDNEAVATVNAGSISGVSPGTTVVFATCGNITAICNVTVLNPAVSVTLNFNTIEMEVGDIEDLIATVEPENTTDTPLWTSSEPTVAIVNDHGIVEAIAPGQTVITVAYGSVSASCAVTVITKYIDELSISPSSLSLKEGSSGVLTAIFQPSELMPELQWSAGDETIISLGESGNYGEIVITALKAGETDVTVTALDGSGLTAQCSIVVTETKPTTISLSIESATLDIQDLPLVVYVELDSEDNAILPALLWESSNEEVATVSATGDLSAEIVPVAEGRTTISVSIENEPSISDSCEITVTSKSSLDDIFNDGTFDGPVDVYDLNGRQIRSRASAEELQDLRPGIYIFRQDMKSKKVLIQ